MLLLGNLVDLGELGLYHLLLTCNFTVKIVLSFALRLENAILIKKRRENLQKQIGEQRSEH